MSDHSVLSRRRAIALFGMSAAGIAAKGAQSHPAPRDAGSGELENVDGSARPQYIFGYGSLVQCQSRVETWPEAEFAFPVIVQGVSRGWFDQTGGTSWNPTYLGALLSKDAVCNGVIFPVTGAELAAYGEREVGHQLTKIDASKLPCSTGVRRCPKPRSGSTVIPRRDSRHPNTPSCNLMWTF